MAEIERDDMPENTGEDLYSDSFPTKESGEEAGEGESRAELLPKSFFPEEPKPGKVCKIRVDSVMEDQVAVSYVSSDKDGETREAPTPTDEEMSDYMS
jgi:hypothetical protein